MTKKWKKHSNNPHEMCYIPHCVAHFSRSTLQRERGDNCASCVDGKYIDLQKVFAVFCHFDLENCTTHCKVVSCDPASNPCCNHCSLRTRKDCKGCTVSLSDSPQARFIIVVICQGEC